MLPAFQNVLFDAAAKIDRVRNDIIFSETRFGRSPKERDILANLKATSYIWLAAIVERSVKGVLRETLTELNSRTIPKYTVKLCLLSLAHSSEFDSLRDIKGMRSFVRRAEAYNAVTLNDPLSLNLAILPIDKKTIRAAHLETIWSVFGFGGNPLSNPLLHRLALEDLADGRNNLAHGEIDPIRFGRSKAYADLLRLIGMVDDILLHLCESSSNYLTNNEYIR